MELAFDKPQRQSAVGIVVMAAHTAFKLSKGLFFVILYLLVKLPAGYLNHLLLGLGLLVLIIIVHAYFSYRRFTFYLNKDAQEFIVEQGIFNRDNLVIPLEKIQQVNITQDILQKIIGVYGLKIDTAGAKGEEVHIRAISEFAAIALREHLLQAKASTQTALLESAQEPVEPRTPLLKISEKTLLKVGLTSHYERSLLLLISFFYFIWHEGRQLIDALKLDKSGIEDRAKGIIGMFSVLIFIIILLLALLMLNLVRTFYKYFELQIDIQNGNLIISAGFIAKRNTILDPKKVQIAAYSQNYFQKKLGLVNLLLKQPHVGGTKKKEGLQGSVIRLPGCSPSEKDKLLQLILNKLPQSENAFLPNWRFLNLPIFFKVVIPTSVFVLIALNNPEIKPYLYLAFIYFIIGVSMTYLSYRKHRISVSEDFIIKQKGIWDISQNILKPSNIQSITTFQYPWHKGLDIGHLNLHTAAGTLHFKYGNYSEIKALVNYWLFLVENKEDNWG